MIRVAFITELPTPYRVPLFERIQDLPETRVDFLFMARSESDRSWSVDVSRLRRKTFMRGHVLEWKGKRSILYHINPAIFTELRRGAYDVVAIAGYSMFTSQASIVWCRMTGTPYLLFGESHHRDARKAWVKKLKDWLLPKIVRPAAGILATGTLSGDYFRSYGAARVYRFANTPDVEALRAEAAAARHRRDEVRAELGIPGDACAILHVGRLIAVKAVDDLIRATGRLGSPVRLVVVGDGPEHEALVEVADREAAGRVIFAGFQQGRDLAEIFQAADVFALASHHEPWGVVVGEAMAHGLPVVLSDRVGAAADLLRDGENGRGFPCGDVDALTAALEAVATDPDRRRLGEASDRIMDGWTYETSVKDFDRAVREAARRRA
jgi:glycosyltransferase involved in cell wall biosynthesis